MLELGQEAETFHAGLASSIEEQGIDLVYACGPLMRALFEALPRGRKGAWFSTSQELASFIVEQIRRGDALMVKGSNGSRMRLVVEEIKTCLDKE